LASERTFSAWVRTGITAEVTGLAIAKLLAELAQQWLTLLTAILFVLVAVGAYAYALWGYRQRRKYLEEAGIEGSSFALWTAQSMILLVLLSAIFALILLSL
jgi:putative membrane protein